MHAERYHLPEFAAVVAAGLCRNIRPLSKLAHSNQQCTPTRTHRGCAASGTTAKRCVCILELSTAASECDESAVPWRVRGIPQFTGPRIMHQRVTRDCNLKRHTVNTAGRDVRLAPDPMKLQCVSLVAAFLLGVSSAACTRLPPSESVLATPRLPAWSSVHSRLLCLRSGPLSAPALLPAPTPVLHMSAPVRRGAVGDARLGLA